MITLTERLYAADFHQNGHLVLPVMHLMYTLDEAGNRVYTLKVRRGLLLLDIRLTNSVEGHGCGKDY